jgi:demethylmenaquinone methyltransferase/2-methoxy-6-polyprenyl-1,4-benzoquinol methylase
MSNKTTHFGYEEVDIKEKSSRVGAVFNSVTPSYDLMNDLMSFGLHRAWKRFAVSSMQLKPGHRVLDVAGGTGDLTALMHKHVGSSGQIVLSDINPSMLAHGKARLTDKGLINNIDYIVADAESLPFPSKHFDAIMLAFGLRNMTDKSKALRSLFRVLKPGGRLSVLEFSTPTVKALSPIYDAFSMKLIPKLGKFFAHDEKSYQYLVESIRKHPDQESLKTLFEEAGFEQCRYHNLSLGIVALHTGYKLRDERNHHD